MAEDTEVPVNDEPKAAAIPGHDDGIEAEDKPEVRVNETESSMLEDESMPTYLSITSNVSSLKPDDSKVQMNIRDADTEDEDGKSVVEVSSGDEGQENSRAYYARRRNNHDDEDDDENDGEYYDDSDDSHINERAGRMRYDETDEDDDVDDEEDDIDEEEEDEESDGDIEPEQFERSSDDYVLRTSNSSLEKHYKERSRSLQDLSSPKKLSNSNSKRHVYMNSEHYDQHPFSFNYNDPKRSSQSQSKYSHITSKVKDYIHDMKSLSKRSAQRRSIDKFNLNAYPVNNDQFNANQDTDTLRLNPQCRRIKNYAEYAMKNMMEDLSRGQSINMSSSSQMAPLLNGDEIISTDAMKHYENSDDMQETMEINDSNAQYVQCSKLINKPNGIIDYSANNAEVDVQIKENGGALELEPLTNGQEAAGPILDIQSLTYEDYMKGNIDSNHKPDEIMHRSIIKCTNGTEVTINPVNLTSNLLPIQLENMIADDSPLQSESIDENESNVEPQIQKLKSNIAQNQIENIERKLYQSVMNENSELKREIEELKRALTIQQEEIKPIEMKYVAVQTEDQPRVMKHTSTETHLQLPNKLSTSTTPEIAFTLSSIEHWTDSEYSPVVSLKPPNVKDSLNSDDSTVQGSPSNLPQTSSRALWTTNRILQTLASMTPGRPLPSVVEKKFDVQGQSKDPISPLITDGQSSRKRKASDSVGTPALGPLPSKIPFTNTTDAHAHRKFNSASDTDGATKSVGLPHAAANQGENIQGEEAQQDCEETDDDGVKCFVWHDDDGAQERSCLIQAPIALDGSTKTGVMKKHVRECGPYLLGNLEVRISEANGTLNIWGKEVSQKLGPKESETIDKEQNEMINDAESFWPKTPRAMLDSRFKCSTTKKMKTPTSVRANISRHLRSMLNRTQSPVNVPVENHTDDIPPNLSHRNTNNCNQCHNHKCVYSPTCSNRINLQTKPFCCAYKPETNVRNCGCRREHESIIENGHYHCEIAHHRPFPLSNPNYLCGNLRRNNVCVNHLNAEEECKHAAACRRLSDSETEDNCRHDPKRRCYSAEIHSCDHQVENNCCQDMNTHGNPHQSEELDPAINLEKSHEMPEKRNRLRGKRVRNLMEFLKSCSDCRNPETSSIDSCQIPETETTNTNTNTRSIPSIRVISDPPSMSSCPQYSYNFENHKGCNSCVKHAGRAAELEAELDVIRVEISKLHSRSNAMRDMLQRVLETDVNTTP